MVAAVLEFDSIAGPDLNEKQWSLLFWSSWPITSTNAALVRVFSLTQLTTNFL